MKIAVLLFLVCVPFSFADEPTEKQKLQTELAEVKSQLKKLTPAANANTMNIKQYEAKRAIQKQAGQLNDRRLAIEKRLNEILYQENREANEKKDNAVPVLEFATILKTLKDKPKELEGKEVAFVAIYKEQSDKDVSGAIRTGNLSDSLLKGNFPITVEIDKEPIKFDSDYTVPKEIKAGDKVKLIMIVQKGELILNRGLKKVN